MGKEIERKFLVKNDTYKSLAKGTYYRQGYVPTVNGMTVRIRIAGDQGFITMKDHAVGFTRHEFEYPIPADDAQQMLELMCAKPQIEKYRYKVHGSWVMGHGSEATDKAEVTGNTEATGKDEATSKAEDLSKEHDTCNLYWEVDEFLGDNAGLVVAEIEVPSEDTVFDIPDWVGEEVTGDKRYYNSHLCNNPYKNWK